MEKDRCAVFLECKRCCAKATGDKKISKEAKDEVLVEKHRSKVDDSAAPEAQ